MQIKIISQKYHFNRLKGEDSKHFPNGKIAFVYSGEVSRQSRRWRQSTLRNILVVNNRSLALATKDYVSTFRNVFLVQYDLS